MAFNYANEADIAMLLAEVRKYVPFYASCSTAASTAAKEINDLTGFSLRTGATIRVKFANSNTAQNPTLNVNNTGAKSIYKYGSSSAGITAGSSWESGAVVTLTYDGTAWIMNDWIDAEFSVMTGATSSTAGTSGLVPAPAAGSQEKYLKGDGTWGNPGGSRPIAYQLDTVTGTGGAYTHTTTDLPVTATMKATGIEVSDTTAFGGQITVTVNDGSITLSCPEVNGTSSVTVSVMQAGDAASGGQTVTSEEFDILSNRIGTMSALTTQTKTTVVGAVNEINQNVNNKVDRSDYDATKIPLSGTDSTSVKQALTNVDADIEKTQSGLAVIVDGDTCSVPVPADDYAYIKSNTHGLANGLYKNISGSAFPVSGGIADNTVFSAVPDGGLNDLKNKMGAVGATDLQSQITSLDSNIASHSIASGIGDASSYSELQTKIETVLSEMTNGETRPISSYISISDFNSTTNYGYVTKVSSTRAIVYFSNPFKTVTYGAKDGSTWSWEKLALNSNLNNKPSCLSTAGSQVSNTQIQGGSGTLRDVFRCYIIENVLVLHGRFVVDTFSRSGGNPGCTFKLPSGKTIAQTFAVYTGAVCDGSGIRVGEQANISGDANSDTITVSMTESYTNVANGRISIVISPLYILIK